MISHLQTYWVLITSQTPRVHFIAKGHFVESTQSLSWGPVHVCSTWVNSKVISHTHANILDFTFFFDNSEPILPHG